MFLEHKSSEDSCDTDHINVVLSYVKTDIDDHFNAISNTIDLTIESKKNSLIFNYYGFNIFRYIENHNDSLI